VLKQLPSDHDVVASSRVGKTLSPGPKVNEDEGTK
jgi:hypothetical protein